MRYGLAREISLIESHKQAHQYHKNQKNKKWIDDDDMRELNMSHYRSSVKSCRSSESPSKYGSPIKGLRSPRTARTIGVDSINGSIVNTGRNKVQSILKGQSKSKQMTVKEANTLQFKDIPHSEPQDVKMFSLKLKELEVKYKQKQ